MNRYAGNVCNDVKLTTWFVVSVHTGELHAIHPYGWMNCYICHLEGSIYEQKNGTFES